MNQEDIFHRLTTEVIEPGLCTHCGTCVGLSDGNLEMRQTECGPLPEVLPGQRAVLSPMAYLACPGRGVNYPDLNQSMFNQQPESRLIGCFRKIFIGYSGVPEIRQRGASGGVITQVLIYLLTHGIVDGVVVLRQGWPEPWSATPIIARCVEDVMAASQSVYIPTSVNAILGEMAAFEGKLAYVGLPDQVASLRCLQQLGHPGALKVTHVLGPYVGTSFYLGAIESYLHSNGVRDLSEVVELRYRAGEWPGYLQIKTRSDKVLQAHKFYYNYLIPFFITQSTLLSVDLTNELTDISVGDAWHPRYEAAGQGFSVVVARTQQAEELLANMQAEGSVVLDETSLQDALIMHGHMLDFKKRGAFIRIGWRKAAHRPAPEYGYLPVGMPLSRILVEMVISGLFSICHTRLARKIVERIPLGIIGPLFDGLRRFWKSISKPAKRKGLQQTAYRLVDFPRGERVV